MTIAVALMLALILAIITICALVDKLHEAEKFNEELMIENLKLRAKIFGEIKIGNKIGHDVAEIMGEEENADC